MKLEVRNPSHPEDAKHYTTERLRKEFLIQDLFVPGNGKMVYTHFDRMIVGGICPLKPVELQGGKELGSSFFLERRELGVINIGGQGIVSVDGEDYVLNERDAIYIGMGTKQVVFKSEDHNKPASFYLNSAPAHKKLPTLKIGKDMARSLELGSMAESNARTLNQYIHPEILETCQLVMGITTLQEGSVWNTMPTHTHDRRMEVYCYFDVPEDAVVFHLMGEPRETRHIIMRKGEAVISPSWSIHSGTGTKNYSFIWGMIGENQEFDDMDFIKMEDLR